MQAITANKQPSYRRDRAAWWVSFGQKCKTIFCSYRYRILWNKAK